jgi:hypothetical protein
MNLFQAPPLLLDPSKIKNLTLLKRNSSRHAGSRRCEQARFLSLPMSAYRLVGSRQFELARSFSRSGWPTALAHGDLSCHGLATSDPVSVANCSSLPRDTACAAAALHRLARGSSLPWYAASTRKRGWSAWSWLSAMSGPLSREQQKQSHKLATLPGFDDDLLCC